MEVKVPFLDLRQQYMKLRDEILSKIDEVCMKSAFTLGEYVEEFEENFASYCSAKYCVGVNSGTSALHLALLAYGVKEGDEVIMPAQTFISTAWAITYCNAKPVFIDIQPKTYTIDTNDIESMITPKTKAIIPVHLYGNPADMDKVNKIAKKHSLFVIEDAAQAHGALYKGKRIGTLGDVACFSFYPGKNLGAFGESGAVITDNYEIAERIRTLRNHGQFSRYYHDLVGFNYRMEGIQGAVLNIKLKYLDEWNESRRQIASLYNELLKNSGLILPVETDYSRSVYHLYVVLHRKRDVLAEFLRKKGVSTGFHYPIPVHLQRPYSFPGREKGKFPESERNAMECLSLPIFPEMTEEQVRYVAGKIKAGLVND